MIRRVLLVLAMAASSAAAQTAAERLASTEPSELAWGAYLAAERQQKDLIPAILPLLKLDNSGVRLAAIDALIRLDADVPEQDLAPLLDGYWLDSTLILLSKDPKKHASFLMSLLDREMEGRQWDALNSILLAAPPPGYAARLLKDLTLGFTVCVQFENPCPGRMVVDGVPFLRRPPESPAGFPPQSVYMVGSEAQGVPSSLAAGPHALSYARTGYRSPYAVSTSWPPDRDGYRWLYLTLLAGFDAQSLDAKLPDSIQVFPWTSPGRFQGEAANFLNSVRGRVSRVRQALIARGLLTAQDARTGPTFEVHVLDQRANYPGPLPPIDWKLDR